MTQLTPEEITDSIYKAYGTDSGILFGIKERDIVKAIVEFTVNRLEAQLKEEKKIVSDLLDQLDDTKKLLYEERERSAKLMEALEYLANNYPEWDTSEEKYSSQILARDTITEYKNKQ